MLFNFMLVVTAPALAFDLPGTGLAPVQSGKITKGAANASELARMVLQAIQNNNFEDLNAFLPDDAAINLLKKKGSEDLKALLENTSADDLKNNIKIKFDDLVQQGVSRTINWSEMALAETKVGKGSAKNPMVQPVILTFTNKAKQPVQLTLETARLNNRFYLFQRMELKS